MLFADGLHVLQKIKTWRIRPGMCAYVPAACRPVSTCMYEGETGLSLQFMVGQLCVCEPPGHNTHPVCVPAHSTDEPGSITNYGKLSMTICTCQNKQKHVQIFSHAAFISIRSLEVYIRCHKQF